MSKRGFDVVMVRRSGPVSSFSLRGGFFYLLAVLLLVLTAGLGLCGGVVYQQQDLVMAMVDEVRMLSLRAERMEALLQEQETREILAQQAAEEKPSPPEKGRGRGTAQPAAQPAAETASISPESLAEAKEHGEQPEPTSTDYIALRNIEQKLEGGDLVVNFDMVNEREGKDPVSGYITLVARGQRNGKPWLEAWPPMRLTNQGRPQSFRRGTPFSVQRYRHVRARVAAINDKYFDQLEFVVYSRQGELVMVHHQPVNLGRPGGGN